MKLQILLLLCILVSGSCQISQKADTNEPTVESSEPIQSVIQTSKPADKSRFSSIKIKRTDRKQRLSLNIDVEYPQLKDPKTPQEIKFNQYIIRHVNEQVLDFTKFLIDKEKGVKDKTEHEYEINLGYTVDYYSKSFASILMNWNGYSGWLNMDYFPATINYDFKRGRVVSLAELFEPKSKYLNKIAEESRKILKRTCLSCGCGNDIKPGDRLPEKLLKEAEEINRNANGNANSMVHYQDGLFFEEGTEPKEENYDNWSVTVEGLKITFGEYQIGPGCIGIIDIIIPFPELQPILRKDLNFN